MGTERAACSRRPWKDTAAGAHALRGGCPLLEPSLETISAHATKSMSSTKTCWNSVSAFSFARGLLHAQNCTWARACAYQPLPYIAHPPPPACVRCLPLPHTAQLACRMQGSLRAQRIGTHANRVHHRRNQPRRSSTRHQQSQYARTAFFIDRSTGRGRKCQLICTLQV